MENEHYQSLKTDESVTALRYRHSVNFESSPNLRSDCFRCRICRKRDTECELELPILFNQFDEHDRPIRCIIFSPIIVGALIDRLVSCIRKGLAYMRNRKAKKNMARYRAMATDTGEWVHGSLNAFGRNDARIIPGGARPHDVEDEERGKMLVEYIKVVPGTVGRFSGKCAANGELYDGDIYMAPDGSVHIVTDGKDGWVLFNVASSQVRPLEDSDAALGKKLGDVHNNPEAAAQDIMQEDQLPGQQIMDSVKAKING